MEFHRLYVGAATGAGRTAVASRSRARGGGDAHLKKNPGAFEDTGARSRLTILSLCPAHFLGRYSWCNDKRRGGVAIRLHKPRPTHGRSDRRASNRPNHASLRKMQVVTVRF